MAATLTSGGHPNSNAPGRRAEDDVNLVVHTLQAADGHHGRRSPRGDGGDNLVVAATINASYDRGAVGHNRDENLVPVAFDHAQITHPANGSRCAPGDPVPTPHAGGDAFVAFASNTRSEVRDLGDKAACLSSVRGTNQTTFIATVPSSLNGGGADAPMSQRIWDGNGIAPTLDTSSPPVAFLDAWSVRGSLSPNQHPCKTDGLSDALDTTGPGAVYRATDLRNLGVTDVAQTIQSGGAAGERGRCINAIPHVFPSSPSMGAVRRLSPLECERLQGLPDGYTCLCGVAPYSTVACKCPDGPRYRAIGNGGAVPVVEWIGRRLLARLGGDLT